MVIIIFILIKGVMDLSGKLVEITNPALVPRSYRGLSNRLWTSSK